MTALLILVCLSCPAQTQELEARPERLALIQKLYEEKKWDEILQSAPAAQDNPAEIDLYRGLALARLERWDEARVTFEAGLERSPRDKRFLVELAGVAYKQNDFRIAKSYLQRALALDPQDAYALEFLGTLYFLENNLEAALEYWNRIEKPEISAIRFDPQLRMRSSLLDRALAFAPLSVLKLEELGSTEARLDNLEAFARYQFVLQPEGNVYALSVRAAEKDVWGNGKLGTLLAIARGLPYQTLYPEYDDIRGSGANIESLLRWDSEKQRFFGAFSLPLEGDPRWRLRMYFDGRAETWDISQTFQAASAPISALKLRKEAAGVEIRRVESGRLSWRTQASFAHRRFQDLAGVNSRASSLFTSGFSLQAGGGLDYQLLRNAPRRMTLGSSVSADVGRFFARPLGAFGKVEGSLVFHWLPKAQGDDLEMTTRFRAGQILGNAPFDEVYALGVERDNDLWARGTPGTQNGRKGSAPMGSRYVLVNWEDDKIVYNHPLFTIKIGPFMDFGKVSDPSRAFVPEGWLLDPGVQCKVRILGSVTVVFSYGRDLRAGRNAFFATALH